MKYKIFVLFILLWSCTEKKNTGQKSSTNEITQKKFQTILDASNVNGVILIYDASNNKYYSNDFILKKPKTDTFLLLPSKSPTPSSD